MNNSIIDLIIRIKNGYLAKKELISSPHSNFKESVVSKLQKLGYVRSFKVGKEGNKKDMILELVYDDGVPALTDVKVFSRPGRRWYINTNDLKPVLGGLGHAVLSTPKGILTSMEAKKEQVGGELLFEIW